MSDLLLELSSNPTARKLIQSAGLPIPMPEELARQKGPTPERPLDDRSVVVAGKGSLGAVLARTLVTAGANPIVVGSALAKAFAEPGEAFGRPAEVVEPGEVPEGVRVHALVIDASDVKTPADLRVLYDFLHPWVSRLDRSGRALVLGRPAASAKTAAQAAAREGLVGFVRSLAKEVGRRGSTANLLSVDEGADDRVPGVLRFVLSPASAFVTGQPIAVSAGPSAASNGGWVQPLAGKVALVTGAARGIGAATAEILASEGAHVVCLDRPEDDGPLSQVARQVGGSVLLADVTDPEAPETIAKALQDDHGGVDIVVHNAGITRDKTLAKMKEQYWDQTIEVNLAAVERITARLLDGVLHDGGRIVCLSSVAGIAGNMGQTNYSASKAGIMGFVRHLAPKLEKRGITVNAIAPGFIETRLTMAIPVVIREVGRRLSALGQGGLPQDVGRAIAFLATPGASGVTGNVLRVCGGAFIGA